MECKISTENLATTKPLVSIIVITYNSSKYVIETLESAKAQTYQNIELIVSDDCSTDNTVEMCMIWIEKNKERFARTELITVEKNTGIAANCNRGLEVSHGDWVKCIAGDDILLKSCININYELSKIHNSSFFFSKMAYLNDDLKFTLLFQKGFELFSKEKKQFKLLLERNYLPAPTAFINRKALIKLGGFDERFPMLEDYPLWLKACKNNYNIYFSDIITIKYRISSESISSNSNVSTNNLFSGNIKYLTSWYKFQQVIAWEKIKRGNIISAYYSYIEILKFRIALTFGNERNLFSVFLINILTLLKPSFYINFFLHNNFKHVNTHNDSAKLL